MPTAPDTVIHSRHASMLLLLLGMASVPASLAQQPDTRAAPVASGGQERCEALNGMHVDAADIGLPTGGASVAAAEWVRAGGDNGTGAHCQVQGAIHPVMYTAPDIRFQVNLPAEWNRRALHFGGGGLNGTVVTGLGRYAKQPAAEPTPLAQGYVTLGSDSGHQSAGGFDGTFYLNSEAMRNFGHAQIKKTHDLAMALVREHYGSAPEYNYFIGGSQGGHEAFDAAQRFPEDYDGVVAGYPAHNVVMLHLSANNYARALQANAGASWLNPAQVNFLVASVYGACDGLDGAGDGIISNVAACREATADFKLAGADNPLRCAGGESGGDGCLADAQLEALNEMDSPYVLDFPLFRDDESRSVFPKWTPFEGSTFTDGGFPNLGGSGPGQALQRAPGQSTIRYAITGDLSLDTLEDFDPMAWAGAISEVVPVLSANSVNLDRFRDKGGKVILFHGRVDDFITPYSSIQYYERLVRRYGQAAADGFFRFYTIPGMGHQTGPFNARLSSLDALRAWVEEGEAPGQLLATDANQATAGRTRPVCRYPGWPRYRGAGSQDEAANFECVDE